jgi:hypothetical protein
MRTPDAPVSFDTTFGFTKCGLHLSVFVVRSPSLSNKFFPIFWAIHESLTAQTYRDIFTGFFAFFNFFGTEKSFAGITADFSDAILAGFLAAARECEILNPIDVIRGCTFHFQKNLHDFSRKNRLTQKQTEQLSKYGRKLSQISVKEGWKSKKFLEYEDKYFQFLNTVPNGEEWGRWWKTDNHGYHWRILFDTGPGSSRANLHSTTNPSESQNRVLKHVLKLKRLPEFGIRPLMKAIALKENQYQLALHGTVISSRRDARKSRKLPAKRSAKRSAKGKHPDYSSKLSQDGLVVAKRLLSEAELDAAERDHDLHSPSNPDFAATQSAAPALSESQLASENSQGPPVQFPLKKFKGPSRLRSPKSLPMWEWIRNSCAYDAMLSLMVFSALHQPQLFSIPNDISESGLTTRLSDLSQFRLACFQKIERVINLWSLGSISTEIRVQQLNDVRTEFRRSLYPRMGLRENSGMNSFASVDRAYEVLTQALSARPDEPRPPPSKKIVIPRVVVFRADHVISELIDHLSCPPGVWFAIEFQLDGANNKDLAAYQKKEIPLSLEFKGEQYDLLGVVDFDGAHYRTFILNRNDRLLRPGIYLLDPLMAMPSISKSRLQFIKKLPTTSRQLANSLPRFTQQTQSFRPNMFIYLKQGTLSTSSSSASSSGIRPTSSSASSSGNRPSSSATSSAK